MNQILDFFKEHKDYWVIAKSSKNPNKYIIVSKTTVDPNNHPLIYNNILIDVLANFHHIENNILNLTYVKDIQLAKTSSDFDIQELSIPITDEEILCLLAILA